MFNNNWFKKHQSKLLWLLNNPITKKWFRYCLRIRKYDCSQKITEITPNSISWGDRYFKKKGKWYLERTTDFRTHNKYSKRLLYTFYPIWYLFHCWDILIANNFKPAWNLGFDTLTQYPDPATGATTVDCLIGIEGTGTWAGARDGTTATLVQNSVSPTALATTSFVGSLYYCFRGIFIFNTSSIGSAAIISAATFSVVGTALQSNANTVSIGLVGCTPASDNIIVAADFDNTTLNSPTEFITRLAAASFDVGGTNYTDMALNANGIAAIAKTANTKLMTRNNRDIDNSAPTGENQLQVNYADTAGTTQDPKLVVTYSMTVKKNNPSLLLMNVG